MLCSFFSCADSISFGFVGFDVNTVRAFVRVQVKFRFFLLFVLILIGLRSFVVWFGLVWFGFIIKS